MVLIDVNEVIEFRIRRVFFVRVGRWGLFFRRGVGGDVFFVLLGGFEF